MYSKLIQDLHGSMKLSYQEQELDFTPPWTRLDFTEEIAKQANIDFDLLNEDKLRTWVAEHYPGGEEQPLAEQPISNIYNKLYDIYIEPHLVAADLCHEPSQSHQPASQIPPGAPRLDRTF